MRDVSTILSRRLPIFLIGLWLFPAGSVHMDALAASAIQRALPRAQVHVLDNGRVRASLSVELATTADARARGLMFRRHLAPDQGMLLLWPTPRRVAIWMKNTYLPLDIVFIDAQGRVLRVHEHARPLDTRLIPSGAPVIAVLEVAAGMARRLGLRKGARLLLPRAAGGKSAPANGR